MKFSKISFSSKYFRTQTRKHFKQKIRNFQKFLGRNRKEENICLKHFVLKIFKTIYKYLLFFFLTAILEHLARNNALFSMFSFLFEIPPKRYADGHEADRWKVADPFWQGISIFPLRNDFCQKLEKNKV